MNVFDILVTQNREVHEMMRILEAVWIDQKHDEEVIDKDITGDYSDAYETDSYNYPNTHANDIMIDLHNNPWKS